MNPVREPRPLFLTDNDYKHPYTALFGTAYAFLQGLGATWELEHLDRMYAELLPPLAEYTHVCTFRMHPLNGNFEECTGCKTLRLWRAPHSLVGQS